MQRFEVTVERQTSWKFVSKFCDDGSGAIDSLQKQIHYTCFFIIPQKVKPDGILAPGTVLKINEEF